MSWFRYHIDAVDNPKIQSLPAVLFKFWVNLLCVSKISHGFLPEISEISFRCRCSEKQAKEWIADLKKRRLIDEVSETESVMHDWNQHQFVSDDVTSRVRKHREKRKRNVSGTPPEQSRAENRAEQGAETANGRGKITDGQPELKSPTLEQAELQNAAERMRDLHPKSCPLPLIQNALIEATGRGALLTKIETSHANWCKSIDWTEQQSKWCPGLAKWLNEEGWKKKPRNPAIETPALNIFRPEDYGLTK